MKISINFFGIVFLSLISVNVISQNGSVLTFSTPDAVYLRWQLLPDANLEGYHIYRKTGSADWQRLTGQPIRMTTSVAAMQAKLGDESALLLTLFGAEPSQRELDKRFLENFYKKQEGVTFLEAVSLSRPAFSSILGLSFADAHGQSGTVFQYKITATVNGRERDWATTPPVEAGSAQEIPTVDDIEGESSHQKAFLHWHKDRTRLKKGEITGYHVYRATTPAGPYLLVNPGSMLPVTLVAAGQAQQPDREQFLDQTVQNGVTYYYHVRAVNAFGFESLPSPVVEITPADDRPLAPPAELEALQEGLSVRLVWQAPRQPVRGYEVYKSSDRQKGYLKVYPANDLLLSTATDWYDWKVSEGSDYFYYIVSVGDAGRRSKPSDTLHFFIPDETPPRAPQGLQAKPERGKITLTWQPNTEPDLKGYLVERSSDAGFRSRLLLTTNPIERNSYTDTLPPTSETTYGFAVIAVDRSGNRSAASAMVKAAQPDITPPQPPFITRLENQAEKVTLGWTKNAEPDVANYRIYRSPANQERWQKIGETASLSFDDRLDRDGQHRYAVTAVDNAGNESPRSQPKLLTYSKDAPPKPPTSGNASAKNNDIVLTWRPHSPTPKGYLVRRTDAAGTHPLELAQLPGNAKDFKDVRASTKKEWIYIVVAFDEKWRMSEELRIRYKP